VTDIKFIRVSFLKHNNHLICVLNRTFKHYIHTVASPDILLKNLCFKKQKFSLNQFNSVDTTGFIYR